MVTPGKVEGMLFPPGFDIRVFWGKAGDRPQAHPLVCHLIDVGSVARALWHLVIPDGMRAQLLPAIVDVEAGGRLVGFWCALHDLGKASPAFQVKRPDLAARVVATGLAIAPGSGERWV